ncbi:MAG: oligoribonuclease, partial [Myxococcota bacterium]
SLAQAERQMVTLVAKWCPIGTGVLAGNSIHTDRRFIKAYFPVLDGYLHYRMVDVSSIKELVDRWYGRDSVFTKQLQQHTALEDIRESIAELQHYREHYMRPIGKDGSDG